MNLYCESVCILFPSSYYCWFEYSYVALNSWHMVSMMLCADARWDITEAWYWCYVTIPIVPIECDQSGLLKRLRGIAEFLVQCQSIVMSWHYGNLSSVKPWCLVCSCALLCTYMHTETNRCHSLFRVSRLCGSFHVSVVWHRPNHSYSIGSRGETFLFNWRLLCSSKSNPKITDPKSMLKLEARSSNQNPQRKIFKISDSERKSPTA